MDIKKYMMPIIHSFTYSVGHGIYNHSSKIGEHKRKVNSRTYRSPRIVLPSGFEDYIGRTYTPFHGKIELDIDYYKGKILDCIILVVWEPKKEAVKNE